MKPSACVLAVCAVCLGGLTGASIANAQARDQGSGIDWQVGPGTGQIGTVAQIRLPEGYRFAGKAGVRRFLELTQNPVSGSELAVLVPAADSGGHWFVIFDFDSVGYIKDDEKDKLDASEILGSIKKGNDHANEERKQRGWAPLEIVGWHTPPRYEQVSNNLTWAIRANSEGDDVVNYSTRLLGRRGVMNVDLVLDPDEVITAVPELGQLLGGFEFTTGNRYAEFTKGDKIAAYGLTALVAGGAGAVLAKSGLLGKLWKVIVFGAVAVLASLRKVFASLFGKKEPEIPPTPAV
jgi:uncharacterized membrane-anchored protein